MKRLQRMSITAIIILIISVCAGCGGGDIQGVVERDSGDIIVTFTVPEGMSVEEVLGSKIGTENVMHITSLAGSGTSDGFCYWYEVDDGGILCKRSDVYRYSPTAESTRAIGVLSPPAWVMITSSPQGNQILNPEDAQKLEEKYGIKLNFFSDN